MLGTLRLVLALAVLISHAGVSVLSLNPGVMAVVVFYAISGYVMNGLICAHFGNLASIPCFYVDRLLRILPQYFIYLIPSYIWYCITQQVTTFTQRAPTWQDAYNNLIIVPLNFFMYNQSDQFTLIPPAWSLGAELQFYVLLPLLIAYKPLFWCVVTSSLIVQGMAWAGFLHAEWWGYRLLPGVLWVFAIGVLISRAHLGGNGKEYSLAKAVVWALLSLVLIAVMLWHYERLEVAYFREVIVGAALALSLIAALGAVKSANTWLGRLDAWLGQLSYGVFLNHFLLLWLFGWHAHMLSFNDLCLLVGASLLLSTLSFMLLEAPILRWRRDWRRRNNVSN